MEKASVPPEKILLGMPFYGKDSHGRPLTFEADIKKLLDDEADITVDWNEENEESVWHTEANRVFTYPTPKFVKRRVQLAESLGVGLSVWEGGQGAALLYDIL